MQGRAFYQLACLSSLRGEYNEALSFAERSLVFGLHNLKARTLKTALLRLRGQTEQALQFARETQKIDPLDHGCCYEMTLLGAERESELARLLRGDAHNYIELALTYSAAGLYEDAVHILQMAPKPGEPLQHYYLYLFTGDEQELTLAESAPSLYCFPNRLEDITALEYAVSHGGQYAAYYLGCLLLDRSRWQEAQALWERCAENIVLPTVWRNLALIYYNKLHDAARARKAMQTAFAMDKTDARVFFELDQLDKTTNAPYAERLARMQENAALLPQRDDLYTEYITLLNLDGQYQKAYDCIMGHTFHPWEGGEGKIPAQYRLALMGLARAADDDTALALLQQALTYPHNLGEGKLIGNLDNDLYEMIGELYAKRGDTARAEEAFRLAARGNFDLTGAIYYNDQPPQMMYYAAKALAALGETDEAKKRFAAFIDYAETHRDDVMEIEYFAVSLPDFLIFEGDLNKNNRVHCCLMEAMGALGLGDNERARQAALRGLAENGCQSELNRIVKGIL